MKHKIIATEARENLAFITCSCGTACCATRAYDGEDLVAKARKNHRTHVRRAVLKASK